MIYFCMEKPKRILFDYFFCNKEDLLWKTGTANGDVMGGVTGTIDLRVFFLLFSTFFYKCEWFPHLTYRYNQTNAGRSDFKCTVEYWRLVLIVLHFQKKAFVFVEEGAVLWWRSNVERMIDPNNEGTTCTLL